MNESHKRGQIVSCIGILCNFVLAAFKIIFGVIFGLLSVIADGINNISDCGSGVVTLVTFRISAKPADKEHPYGHQRAEYIASMLIGFFVLLLAFELLQESVDKILLNENVVAGWVMYLLLGVSIGVKAGMFLFYRVNGRILNSDALRAAATDSACDCLATFAVIVGLLLSDFLGFPADGWAGLLVGLFIVWQGIGIVKDASSKLLGQAPDESTVNAIKDIILSTEGVLGVHDLRVYRFGPQKYFATVHVELSASVPPLEAHEILDGIEHRVLKKLKVDLTAHLDPIDLNDGEVKELESRIRAGTDGMIPGLNLHDFRIVRRSKTHKLIFEAAVPFDCKMSDSAVESSITGIASKLCNLEISVSVERE